MSRDSKPQDRIEHLKNRQSKDYLIVLRDFEVYKRLITDVRRWLMQIADNSFEF